MWLAEKSNAVIGLGLGLALNFDPLHRGPL